LDSSRRGGQCMGVRVSPWVSELMMGFRFEISFDGQNRQKPRFARCVHRLVRPDEPHNHAEDTEEI